MFAASAAYWLRRKCRRFAMQNFSWFFFRKQRYDDISVSFRSISTSASMS